MAKVSLRIYDREIEGLIEHGQRLDEAIAHCRHILKTYPKQLETYRLLGKAYLEAKRYNEAVEIFQRVLMVAPDDFVAHVGMSIIADDQGKLDEAIWHMERAFEVQPSNAAIQGELQRLFGRRDGVEPPKIRLTRGALAHMYVQGELFTQAISEIRAVLSNDAKRVDMQALLATAYFRNGQKAEATDICNDLLTRYPYCLQANRLMVEILPGTQQAAAVQSCRQRVIELDPYAAFAQESIFDTEKVADSAVSLERLEYTGQSPVLAAPLGIGLEAGSTLTGGTSHQPGWLLGAAPPAAASLGAGSASAPAPDLKPAPEGKDELPDFLRQAGWAEPGGGTEQPPMPSSQGEAEPAAVQGDLPDWVKALAPADEAESATQPAAPSSESASQIADTPEWLRSLASDQPSTPVLPAAESAPDVPDWLKSLGDRELDEPSASVPAAQPAGEADWLSSLRAEQKPAPEERPGAVPESSQEASPDWLKDFDNDLETPIQKTTASPAQPMPEPTTVEPPAGSAPAPPANLGALGTTAQEQDDAMAWLEGLAAKHGAKPEELVTNPDERSDVAPQWVDKAKEIGEQAPETGLPPVSSDDATGMWLRNLEPDQAAGPAPKHEIPGAFDLRSSLSDKNDFAVMDNGNENEETPIMDEGATPDWLAGVGQSPAQKSRMEDVPDWLQAASSEPAKSEASIPPEPSPASASAVDLPDWLAGLDKEEQATSSHAGSSDDLPPWLHAGVEPEPQVTERTSSADWQPVESKPTVQPEPQVSDKKMQGQEGIPAGESISQPAEVPAEASASTPVAPRAERKAPVVVRPRPAVAPVATKVSAAASLGGAQSELGRGNIAAALDLYGKLIRKGKSLEEIIRDLRDALYRYPVEVPIWQALGDAYMRANRLQEALDAYTKAEELLR